MPQTAPFAEPPTRATSNRRLTIRYAGGAHMDANLTNNPLSPFQKVRIQDISQGGVSLILPQRPALGATILLQMTNHVLGFTCDLAGEVRHVTPDERGSWLVGLAFEQPLSLSELDGLI
jgi:hypothetical protein